MKRDPIIPWVIWVGGIATTILPILTAIIRGATLLGIVGIGMATLAIYMLAWLFTVARAFRNERDQNNRYHKNMRRDLERSQINNRVRQSLLDEVREETDDLNDRVADLEVTNAKVGTQHELVKKLQGRVGRLNRFIETGQEERSYTTLEDVYKLTGEIETPEPTFKEINDVREEND